MFHVSRIDLGPSVILTPRIPETSVISIEGDTPRVCFAPTVWQCLLSLGAEDDMGAIMTEILDEELNPTVYVTRSKTLHKPDETVSDFAVTQEHWSIKPIKVRRKGYLDMPHFMMTSRMRLCENMKHGLPSDVVKMLNNIHLKTGREWTKFTSTHKGIL